METPAARILLIEDDPAFAYLLKRALDAEPFRCKLTALDDGAEALTFIQRRGESAHLSAPDSSAPDLIVLDLHLPKYNGIELLEAIRGGELANIPVAVLSGSESPEEKAKVAALNACFIEKPMNLDQFSKIGKKIGELASKGKASRVGTGC